VSRPRFEPDTSLDRHRYTRPLGRIWFKISLLLLLLFNIRKIEVTSGIHPASRFQCLSNRGMSDFIKTTQCNFDREFVPDTDIFWHVSRWTIEMYDHSELLALQRFRRGTILSSQCDSYSIFLTAEFLFAFRLSLPLRVPLSRTGELSTGLSYTLVNRKISLCHESNWTGAFDSCVCRLGRVTFVLETDDVSVRDRQNVFWKNCNYPYPYNYVSDIKEYHTTRTEQFGLLATL
jgi:hypothetical protein